MAENSKIIQWYPGHMNKAKNEMKEKIQMVDLVIELRDARIVFSSFNPLLDDIIKDKKRLLVITKKDKADPHVNSEIEKNFKEQGVDAVFVDCNKDNLSKMIPDKVHELLKEKIDKYKAKGIRNKVMRVMVCGIPNVGKSTFINKISKRNAAKAENRPGVTRSLNWIKISNDIEMLDTPGVLWPSFKDERIGYNLALVGSINDDILDKEALCVFGLKSLKEYYPNLLIERYSIEKVDDDIYKLIEDIARSKKWFISNGEIDYDRAYNQIITDIRNDKIGRISFERV